MACRLFITSSGVGGFGVLYPCLHVHLCGQESERETSKQDHHKRGMFPADPQYKLRQPSDAGSGHSTLLIVCRECFLTDILQ